jgi:phosphopantothenoylcysteine synthetase/decarboxylase
MKRKNVILGVTGSIAAFKAAEIAGLLVKEGCAVDVVMTREAEHFITALTMQMTARGKVHRSMFEVQDEWDVEHVSLADKADLLLVAPATAQVLAKFAAGIADDLLTCVALATRAPVLVAPAMNDAMYTHPATQENIARLKKFGYRFIGPDKGRLACGRDALGRMSAPQEIVKTALGLLK